MTRLKLSLHKEGYKIILITLVLVIAMSLAADYFIVNNYLRSTIMLLAIVMLVLVLQFFRNPKRTFNLNEDHVVSPVDGKVVVIEEVFEKEFFNEKRLQVSVFMSPINVHVTRYPVAGEVVFSKYHPKPQIEIRTTGLPEKIFNFCQFQLKA